MNGLVKTIICINSIALYHVLIKLLYIKTKGGLISGGSI